MDSLTKRILELSGPMPDPVAHARYLDTLTEAARKERLTTLLQQGGRPQALPVRFWQPYDKQTNLAIP